MEKQKTLKAKVSFEGIGLHTGDKVGITISPAPPNTGIIFVKEKEGNKSFIKADFYSVLDPSVFPRRTSVGEKGNEIHTIEHLMAAFSLLGVDNAQIDINGSEVPGMDGSAKDFIEGMRKVGLEEQNAPRNYIVVREPLWVDEGGATLVLLPAPHFRVSYTLSYNSEVIGSQFFDGVIDSVPEATNIHLARTFCLEDEVKPLVDMGLGKGANYQNTLVISQRGIVRNSTRVENEFVRHKVLDLIGDLYLAGPIKAHVVALRSGHNLNIKLLYKLRRYKERLSSSGVGNQQEVYPAGEVIEINEIMNILPHRYPFLLVDRIIHMEKGKKAIGIKNVTINDYFFQGHFPQKPIMPGVLIIEAMAQVGGVLMLAQAENRGKLAYFLAADKVKFRRTVVPGDQLVLEVVSGKIKSKTGQVHTRALVGGSVVAEADLRFALVDK